VIAASLAFTWLNPAVYLDTLVLLGSVATAHPASRWWFGAGASTASVSWFIALGFGARRLSPLLSHAHAARILDILIAVVMVMTAVRTLAA
jgi:L-lysine exporter family protein LysE/ArgO